MNKTEKIKKNILKKFMYNPKLKYNEIWDKLICSSSNFDYHLKSLITDNILEKKDDYYILTNEGTILITEIDGKTANNNKKPASFAFVLVQNKNGEILMNLRKKQPFFNYLNIPGGKIELGEFAKNAAIRELKEETGISANLKLKLICEKITFNNEDMNLKHHIIGYFYIGINPKGKLIEEEREGNNFWIKPKDLTKYTRFLDLDQTIPKILKKDDKVRICEIKRYMEKEKIKKVNINWLN